MIDTLFRPQDIFIVAVALLALSLMVVVVLVRRNPKDIYEQLPSILTKAEQQFFKSLSSALGERYIISCKVRIADILRVRRHNWKDFSRISQKHIDFVLVDKYTFITLALIELDDKSHGRFERMERDRFVNHIMQQSGLPLHRFKVRRYYNRAAILQELNPSLNASTITK